VRYVFALVAIAMVVAFLWPIASKLRTETALLVVIGIGIAMMLVDMWQDLRD
jgi:hypothetical protein